METINEILNFVIMAGLIGMIILLILNLHLAIKLFILKRKQKALRHQQLIGFCDMIRTSHKDLKPFFIILNRLIKETLDWQTATLEDLYKINNNYNFYINTLNLIIENKFVSDDDIIRFASLHVYYVKFSRNYQKIKTLEPMKELDWFCKN